MPGVFGGEEISEIKNKCLKRWNYTMIVLIVFVAAIGYSFMLISKLRISNGTTKSDNLPNYQICYILFSFLSGAM